MRVPKTAGQLILGMLLSLAMVVFPFSANISAAAAVNVSVSPPSSSALQGGDFWVNLNVNSVDNLTQYWLDVAYNPAVIQVVGAEGGPGVASGLIGTTPLGVTGWTFLPTPGTASGTIHITGAFGTGSSFSGTGYLARIHFNVIGAGGQSSSITPANVNLWGFNGTTNIVIEVNSVASGTLTVAYPPVIVTIDTPGEVSSGDDFVARVNISAVVNLAAYQLVLSYNPAVIQVIGGGQNNPEGVTRGLVGSTIIPLDQWGYYPDEEPGTMIVLGHLPEAGQTSGSGYLADIHFRAVGAQGTTSSISFTTVTTGFSKLFDNTGTKMTGVVWTNTSVNIISPYRITNSSPLPVGEVGRPYLQTLGAINGVYPYTFDIATGSLPAGLTMTPAGQISGIPTTAAGANLITFRVTDSTGAKMTKKLSMTIAAQPAITNSSPLPGGSATAYYSYPLVVSGGVVPFTWTVTAGSLPTGLSLSQAGVISGTPTVAGEANNFTVTVVDGLGGSASAALSITISAGPVISGGSTLANGELSVAYLQTLVATGGTQPYSWAQIGGTLPPGLSFAAGAISGTPTVAGGPYSFTIQVSDRSGAFFNALLNITIVANPVIATISPLTTGEVKLAYSQQLSVSGGLSPFTWSVYQGNLPSGLTLNSTGLISGTPTVAISSASVTFQVTDAVQKFNRKNFFITTIAAPTITTAALPNAQIGLNYSQLLGVTGGLSPCTWALQPGNSLPAGLTLTSGGLIFGVPTTLGGPITFGVKVTDSMGGFATAIYSITVVSGPVITTPSPLPLGEINVPYTQTLIVDGGIFPFTWTKQSGAFPAGLTLSSAGIISGTPTTVGGPTKAVVKVTDANNSTNTKEISITINAAPNITTTGSLPSGEINLFYSYQLLVTGGVGPFTWINTTGNWPAGLSLSSSGLISGTPTALGGPATLTIKATDSLRASSTVSVNITIVSGPAITTGSALNAGEVSAYYTKTLAATGGVLPYTWTLTTGALPPGLSLSTAGVISGTPTASVSASFGVLLTDYMGGTANANFTLIVASGPVITTTSPLRDAEINLTYNQPLTVIGGTGPYTWSKVSGTLPAGVNFTTAGVFYGTPTAAGGPYSPLIKVTDSKGAFSTSTLTFNVAAYPAIATTSPLTNGEVNLFYSRTLAVSGGVGPFSWSKQSGSWPAGLTLSSDGVLSGTPTTVGSSTNIVVRVTDSYSMSTTATLSITIVSAPAITTTTLPSSAVSAVYNQTLQRTGGVSPFTWLVITGALPPGLTLSTNGVISGTPTVVGSSPFTVKLTDSMGGIATQNLSITIAAAPQITTALTLPNGEVSAAYSQTLQVTGGLTPLNWAVTLGTLPAGLSLTSAGVITGTPTTAGGPTYVTIRVTDALSATASAIFNITIVAAPHVTSSTTLPNGEVNLLYTTTLLAGGGTGTYSWTKSGTWPTWMTLSTAGVLSGTPTAAGGPTSLVVRVTDSLNVSATATLSITIVSAPIITTTTLPNGEVSALYNQNLLRTGGVSPFTWLVATGALPAGLTLSSDGLISGTPTASGPSAFSVSLTDSMGGIATQGLSITVAAAPQISTPLTLPNGEVSAAYNQTLQVTGGVLPLTWTVTLGSLPAGLNLSTAGVITGSPTTAGGPTYMTIKMTDALGAFASAIFNITIVAAPSINTGANLPNAEVSVNYTQTLGVSGGTAPFTWSLPSGSALPSGLALSAAGVITGIPTVSGGPTSFNVRVTDKLGIPANQLFNLTVIAAPSILTTSPLTDGEIGISYSRTMAYSGGTAPYSWSASGLPAGLTISTAGIISGTPAESGSFMVDVTLTDSFSPPAAVTRVFSIHIYNAVEIVTSSLAEVMQGKTYSQSLVGQGGNSAYTWSSGVLPAGLTISNSGVISGTPTVSGNFIVTIGLADSISGTNYVFKTLTLKVYMPYDANGNGIIDMGDVVKIERIILGFDVLTPASDADGSGVITMNDVVKLERVILGLDK